MRVLNLDPELGRKIRSALGDKPVLCVSDFEVTGDNVVEGRDFRVEQKPMPDVPSVGEISVFVKALGEDHPAVMPAELATDDLDAKDAKALVKWWCRSYGVKTS